MKQVLMSFLAVSLILIVNSVVWSGDFDTVKFKPSKKPPEVLAHMSQQEWDIVIADRHQEAENAVMAMKNELNVGIPPDSLFSNSFEIGTTRGIVFMSQGTVESIKEFYTRDLTQVSDWHWSEQAGMFYKSGDPVDHVEIIGIRVPILQIDEIEDIDLASLFIFDDQAKSNLKSTIRVYYPSY